MSSLPGVSCVDDKPTGRGKLPNDHGVRWKLNGKLDRCACTVATGARPTLMHAIEGALAKLAQTLWIRPCATLQPTRPRSLPGWQSGARNTRSQRPSRHRWQMRRCSSTAQQQRVSRRPMRCYSSCSPVRQPVVRQLPCCRRLSCSVRSTAPLSAESRRREDDAVVHDAEPRPDRAGHFWLAQAPNVLEVREIEKRCPRGRDVRSWRLLGADRQVL